MTMQELERQVAAALHRRAEEAMNETDTDQLLRQLPSSVDRQKHDRRRALTVTGLVEVCNFIFAQTKQSTEPVSRMVVRKNNRCNNGFVM